MTRNNTDLIPTRLRLSGTAAKATAKHLMDQLVGGWGLSNATKIVATLVVMLKAEKKRRKELEEK